MARDIICPDCDKEFEAEEWEDGECPNCGHGYYWEEYSYEDTDGNWDDYAIVEWTD